MRIAVGNRDRARQVKYVHGTAFGWLNVPPILSTCLIHASNRIDNSGSVQSESIAV